MKTHNKVKSIKTIKWRRKRKTNEMYSYGIGKQFKKMNSKNWRFFYSLYTLPFLLACNWIIWLNVCKRIPSSTEWYRFFYTLRWYLLIYFFVLFDFVISPHKIVILILRVAYGVGLVFVCCCCWCSSSFFAFCFVALRCDYSESRDRIKIVCAHIQQNLTKCKEAINGKCFLCVQI